MKNTKKVKYSRPLKHTTLDHSYQFKICLWVALGHSTAQIIQLLKDQGIKMSAPNIDHNYRGNLKWKRVINYLRLKYIKNIAHIPIADKTHRLWALQEALDEAMTWRVKSISKNGTKVWGKAVGVVPALINEAREETKSVEAEDPFQNDEIEILTGSEGTKYRNRFNRFIGVG